MTANRTTAVVIVVLAAIFAATVVSSRGPAPLPSNAPDNLFSASRAIALLGAVIGNTPHPIGSPAHDIVRDRIVAEFQHLGYETTMQQAFTCNAYGTCANVSNVLAYLPGDARADTLMVSAHYDSVAAGPGASDDGIGFASVLEVARAVRRDRFRNTILFLITDGEEDGLLGAEAFAADAKLSHGVAADINIDNRGNAGRSYLFETSRHNRWLLPLIARNLPRPSASSFFYNMYELLPNDTDMSVFKRAGIAGINFACIGRVAHYHTPLDDMRHVTPSTVQDHGDHVLAMTRALAATDLRQATDENAVFFDVMSTGLLWWPQSWTLWMAIAALIAVLFGAAILIRKGDITARTVTVGVFSFFVAVLSTAVVGGVVAWLVSLSAPGATWVAQPGPIISAMWLIGVAIAVVCAAPMYRRAAFEGLFIGHALCWIAMSVTLAAVLPGGAYLTLVPAIAFAVCIVLRATLDLSPGVSAIITSAVTAIVWFPVITALYDLIGRPSLGVIATLVALTATTFTPAVAPASPVRSALVAAMAAAAVLCIGMQILLPPFNPNWPRAISVQYLDDGLHPQWIVNGVTTELRKVAPFLLAPADMYPWSPSRRRAFAAPAPALSIDPPQIKVTRGDKHLSLQIRSARNAPRLTLIFHANNLASLTVNGVRPPQGLPKYRLGFATGWHLISVSGVPEVRVEIALKSNEDVDAVLSDTSFGLPPQAAPIVRARDASTAVPSDTGDSVVVRRRIKL